MLNGQPTSAATEKQSTALMAGNLSAETGSIVKLKASITKCIEKLDGRNASPKY